MELDLASPATILSREHLDDSGARTRFYRASIAPASISAPALDRNARGFNKRT